MTQKELAKVLGISKSYMSELESNKRNPSIETIKKISENLNVTISFLVEGSVVNWNNLTEADKEKLTKNNKEVAKNQSENYRESLLYFLNNPSNETYYKESISLLDEALLYSRIHETKGSEDPKLIRFLAATVSLLNAYSLNDSEISLYSKEEIKEQLNKRINFIIDNI